jgi:hypothetical protein
LASVEPERLHAAAAELGNDMGSSTMQRADLGVGAHSER